MVTEKFSKVIASLLKSGYIIENNSFGIYLLDDHRNYITKFTQEQLNHLLNKLSLTSDKTKLATYYRLTLL